MSERVAHLGKILALCAGLGASAAPAQDYMPPTSNPPAAEYEPQGEYVGFVSGGAKLGAWVVSRGGSRFDVVLLPGGLLTLFPNDPNGGWDGKTRYSAVNVALTGTTFNATLNGGGTAYQLTSITGSGAKRTLNGTAGGSPFSLARKTGVNGIGGARQALTLGLRPEGKAWSTGFQSLFVDGNKSTQAQAQADLAKWKSNGSGVQLKYGNFLFCGVQSVASHGTCFLHIEVRSSFMPSATGQSRGNSGIYLRGMHEQQVLDSFGSTGTNDELGAVYKIKAPLVNAALPPLTWQVYDIYYAAGAGTNGTFTTYLNGVKVQDETPVSVVTEAGFNGTNLYLQYHQNQVIYNNIWIIPNATTKTLPYEAILSGLPVPRDDTIPDGLIRYPHAPGRGASPGIGDPRAYFDAMGRAFRGGPMEAPVLFPLR